MNKDGTLLYTIKWTQPYPYSMDFVVLDLTALFEQTVEDKLSNNDFTEAVEIINRIKNKK